MSSALYRRLGRLVALIVPISLTLSSLPLRAASALAAWSLQKDGVLQLRTSKGITLEAFSKYGSLTKFSP